MPRKQAIGIVALMLLTVGGTVRGQFTTVINLPGDAAPVSTGPGTQLNILSGGQLGTLSSPFTAFGGELNLLGGTIVAPYTAMGSATTNLVAGHVRATFILNEQSQAHFTGGLLDGSYAFGANDDAELRISGGEFSRHLAATGNAQVEISGGRLYGPMTIRDNAQLNVAGGLFYAPDLVLYAQSQMRLQGGEFRIDGVPVEGLATPGARRELTLDLGQYLSGTLADGTPLVFRASTISTTSRIELEATELPAAPSTINLPSDPAPLALRDGQTLHLGPGGLLGPRFVAGWNSTLIVNEGQVGAGLRAYGAEIHVKGGAVAEGFQTVATRVTIEGGALSQADFTQGSIVDISGGTLNSLRTSRATVAIRDGVVGQLRIAGGDVRMTGGLITNEVLISSSGELVIEGGQLTGSLEIIRTATATLEGGIIQGPISVGRAGVLDIHGGSIESVIEVDSGADLTLYGTHFALTPPPGDGPETDLMSLLEPGVPYLLQARNATLTAVLADGSPFDLELLTTSVSGRDFVHASASLYLVLVQVPEPGTITLALLSLALAALFRCRTRAMFSAQTQGND